MIVVVAIVHCPQFYSQWKQHIWCESPTNGILMALCVNIQDYDGTEFGAGATQHHGLDPLY